MLIGCATATSRWPKYATWLSKKLICVICVIGGFALFDFFPDQRVFRFSQ